jgi:hypothetical protein
MYHMIALPHRVRHQQFGAQLQIQLNGLWTLSRRLRPIRADLSQRLSNERNRLVVLMPRASLWGVLVLGLAAAGG